MSGLAAVRYCEAVRERSLATYSLAVRGLCRAKPSFAVELTKAHSVAYTLGPPIPSRGVSPQGGLRH